MRIGLIGAPGSGKSKVAKKLQKALETQYQAESWPIVDRYVPRLSKATGLAYGHFANYVDNMAVAFKRREQEQMVAPNPEDNLITCGTVLDTVAYAFNVADASTVSRQELPYALRELNAVMTAYAWLYTQTFTYDITFYLEHPERTIRQDQVLRATIEEFFAPTVRLENDTVDRQIESAVSVIKALDAPTEDTGFKQSGV